MPFIIDLILLALLCIPVFLGWRRGFFGSALRLGRLALAFLITVGLGSTVSGWLDDRFVYPAVYESVYETFDGLADEVSATTRHGADALAEKIPTVLRPYLDTHDLDPSADVHELAEEWSERAASGVSRIIAAVLGYLLVFAVAFILLTVAVFLVGGLIHRIPLVRTADRILGLSLGILIGGLGVLLLSALLAAVLTVAGQTEVVEASRMLRLSAGIREMIRS